MEKRKYLRFKCLLPAILLDPGTTSSILGKGEVKEFSREGLRLVLDFDQNFGAGSSIELMLRHPKGKISSLVTGEIIWARYKLKKVEMGLRIKKMDELAKCEFLDWSYSTWRDKTSKKGKKRKPFPCLAE